MDSLIDRISPRLSLRSTSSKSPKSPKSAKSAKLPKSKRKRRTAKLLTVKPNKSVKNNQKWQDHLTWCANEFGISKKRAAGDSRCRNIYYSNQK